MSEVVTAIGEESTVAKRYFTINEAAKELEEGPHIIRRWLKTFDCFSPRKHWPRKLNEADIENMKIIKDLLRESLYKVEGAKQVLKEEIKRRREEQRKRKDKVLEAA